MNRCTGGTIIANQLVDINAREVNSVNVAAANSATGGTLGANTVMTSVASGKGASVTGALNITLPTSGVYRYDKSPDAQYLIATDPRLASCKSFISSDYMLSALNFDPVKIEKRLGDGLYEQQLIRNQITQLTGRVYLDGYMSNEDQYRALMTNGVNFAQTFNLLPGLSLTAAQMDVLTSDIVWLVGQVVTLPDGSTQHVLAPVVYMAHACRRSAAGRCADRRR